jgi:hypothetical protein
MPNLMIPSCFSNRVSLKARRPRSAAGAKQDWSGRRESNPRMQLGKRDVSQSRQYDSYKTVRFGTQIRQWVTIKAQNCRMA